MEDTLKLYRTRANEIIQKIIHKILLNQKVFMGISLPVGTGGTRPICTSVGSDSTFAHEEINEDSSGRITIEGFGTDVKLFNLLGLGPDAL